MFLEASIGPTWLCGSGFSDVTAVALEASVGPNWFCGTGSSGSTLSAIDVAPCVFGFPMTAGSKVLFNLSRTVQTFGTLLV